MKWKTWHEKTHASWSHLFFVDCWSLFYFQKLKSRWSSYCLSDTNQQASAVGLECFWFACDHAITPFFLLVSFSFVCFCLVICFYWLKFEFDRHSLWTGWMYQLSGERRSGLYSSRCISEKTKKQKCKESLMRRTIRNTLTIWNELFEREPEQMSLNHTPPADTDSLMMMMKVLGLFFFFKTFLERRAPYKANGKSLKSSAHLTRPVTHGSVWSSSDDWRGITCQVRGSLV